MNTLPANLDPIANHILFQFNDEVDRGKRGAFKEKTNWGFELKAQEKEASNYARFVTIIGLGPDVDEEFYIGQTILIEPLKWTRIVEYKGVRFARTDDTFVLAVSETN